MNGAQPPIGEDDLQAFVDDRLSEARRAQVEAYLAEHPEIRDQLAIDRGYRGSLRTQLAGKFDEPIPTRLRIATIRSARRAARMVAIRSRVGIGSSNLPASWLRRLLR